jgi:hypothetical protein
MQFALSGPRPGLREARSGIRVAPSGGHGRRRAGYSVSLLASEWPHNLTFFSAAAYSCSGSRGVGEASTESGRRGAVAVLAERDGRP